MDPKLFEDDPEAAASQLVQTTIIKSGTPVARIAQELGKSEDLVYKWANAKATEQNIHLFAALKLMRITGDLTILREAAALFGFVLLPEEEAQKIKEVGKFLGNGGRSI